MMREEEHRIGRGAREGSLVTIEVGVEWCEHPRALMGVEESLTPNPVIFGQKFRDGGLLEARTIRCAFAHNKILTASCTDTMSSE